MRAKSADELEQLCRERKIRCLVVEDDEALRTLISRVLRDFGMDVFDTEDGRAAVVAHHQIPFDLLILSWFNKNFNGERMLETMHNLCPRMPKVIIMPGLEAVSICSPVPVAGFLFKPFDIEKLASVVIDALGVQDARH
jgi:DNA-binding NtrC family response regulator